MYFEKSVSSDFPFSSKYININGSKLHYVDIGTGDPIVFVHGVPASAYLWRNIIPALMPTGRCIAVDLIGFGQSERPDINYDVQEHIYYFNQFIDALNLTNITFVLHGWGSVLGFNYIAHNMEKVKGVVFYEAHIHPETDWNQLSLPVQQLASLIKKSTRLEKAIVQDNYFMKKIFPMSMLHLPEKDVMNHYQAPFKSPQHRLPLLQYINDLPIGEAECITSKIIANYSNILQQSSIPKLLLYSVPGFLTPIETVKWCRDHLSNIQLIDLGEELHFAQETMPTFFGQILNNWYQRIN